ncbi:MAG TPA: GreA/GreB family elongation factor [Sphingobacteriaceae bacterium]
MQKSRNSLVLRKDDYELIQSFLRSNYHSHSIDSKNAEELKLELKKAKLVNADKFPADAVGLNSKVKIKEDSNERITELILVTPDKADIKEGKISVLAPIGTALIGFRQGQKVKWQVPSGRKIFTIMEVQNHND